MEKKRKDLKKQKEEIKNDFNNGNYEGAITNIFNNVGSGNVRNFLNRIDGFKISELENKISKKDVYKKSIFKYGFITLLYLLEEYKQADNFEECKIILEALQEHYKEFDMEYLPTEYNDFAKEESQAGFWKYGLSGEIAKNNLQYYAMDLKEEIIAHERK